MHEINPGTLFILGVCTLWGIGAATKWAFLHTYRAGIKRGRILLERELERNPAGTCNTILGHITSRKEREMQRLLDQIQNPDKKPPARIFSW